MPPPATMPIEPNQSRLPKLGEGVYLHASATVIGDVELSDAAS